MDLNDVSDFTAWVNLYRKLVYWELELAASNDTGMDEILLMQKTEANREWTKFIKKNFVNFLLNQMSTHPLWAKM